MLGKSEFVNSSLFTAQPHIFVSAGNPLAKQVSVSMEDLTQYPYLSYEQGDHNSFYFSEDIFSTMIRSKNIRVMDRATLLNLLIGLNGYTVCSGVIDKELNGENIVAIPLRAEGEMHIGVITHKKAVLNKLGKCYIEALKKYTPSA